MLVVLLLALSGMLSARCFSRGNPSGLQLERARTLVEYKPCKEVYDRTLDRLSLP